jgi:hypothetical protein
MIAEFQPVSLVPLDPFLYQDPRPCLRCGGEQTFVQVFEFAFGRVGYCEGCGEEKVIRFERTMGEEG